MVQNAINIDPSATYSKASLATLFGVTTRCIEKWVKGRRSEIPRPFYVGRQPFWKGDAIMRYLDRKQEEAAL